MLARIELMYDTICRLSVPQSAEELDIMEKMINDAQPQDMGEHIMRMTIRELYNKNTYQFFQYIMNNGLCHLCLWLNSRHIMAGIHMEGKAHLQWTGEKYNLTNINGA